MTAGHYPTSRALAPTLCPPTGVRGRWITRASRKLVWITRIRRHGCDRLSFHWSAIVQLSSPERNRTLYAVDPL
ncbi:MAG: hypothetical protein ACXACI_05465 [Candidatus Hodarchaeales archaeon]